MTEPVQMKCPHILSGRLPVHSTIAWRTVPPEQSTTTYEWNKTLVLCPFCSGKLMGWMGSSDGLGLGLGLDEEPKP